MFWNRKPNATPLGVPLGDLMAMLEPTTIKATLKGDALIAQHEHYTIRIEVVPPAVRESENGPIRAVVRLITELPAPLLTMFRGRAASAIAGFNAFAALGALYQEGPLVRIGSRLTVYEAEDAWRTLHLPLLAFTIICGSEAILGGLRRTMTNEKPRGGTSQWTERDMAQVESYMSRMCVCTTGGLGLTAEFGLANGAESAIAGDHQTALFQLMADQPHPELGGGLFCLLQMPHRMASEDRLAKVCLQLNEMEMAAHDLPPHFGAWCPGRLGNNPAYVSFLPNALHAASGIAVNSAFWARNRAQWANAMLASLGVRA
jgi:hypothetical protein